MTDASEQFDFIVVGGGIAGASIAYHLAGQGRTCLLEAESMPGMHATGRSAALLSLSYGGPVIRAVTRAGLSFFEAPPEGFAEHTLLEARGQLFIGREDQRERIEAITRDIRQSGERSETLDYGAAATLVPLLRADQIKHGVLEPDSRDIDVDGLHQGFLREARSRGAAIRTDSAVSRGQWIGGQWHVTLRDGTITAPVLINAAGAWADDLARKCNVAELGFAVLRRTAILIDPPADISVERWPAVIDADSQFYFKPDAGKLLLSPADEIPDVPGDAQPEELDIAIAVDRVQGALDIEVRRISHSWAGLRTFAPDRVPVAGFDTTAQGFFWLAGQGGSGVQTAPGLARIAASLIIDGRLPPEIDVGLAGLLSPKRFQL